MRSEQSDEQSAEQLQEVKHPEARITHRGICASPDTIFGSHSQTKIRRSAVRSLSLAGADRFKTTSCWRRNAVSASRAARDLNSPTSNPPSSFKRSSIPKRG